MGILLTLYTVGVLAVFICAMGLLAHRHAATTGADAKEVTTLALVLPTGLGYALGWPLVLPAMGVLRAIRFIVDRLDDTSTQR